MSESRKITVAKTDDWIMIFADERCVWSGHSCSATDLLDALNYEDVETAYFEARTCEEEDAVADLFWGTPTLSEFEQRAKDSIFTEGHS